MIRKVANLVTAVLTGVLFGAFVAPPAFAGTTDVVCSLPYVTGATGSDCNGWHQLLFSTSGTSPSATVTAELLGVDLDGVVIQSLKVDNGDTAHLASRPNWKISTKTNKHGARHTVYAPIPLLRVTVEDEGQKYQAYCSNIPYLQVIEPQGQVVTEDAGNVTNVLAAIPLTDGASLDLKVDGVHLFDALSITNPADCSVGSPCGGVIDINGSSVTISNLVVDLAPSVDVPSSNTLRMSLEGLACGGHKFVLYGERGPGLPREPASEQCHLDDVYDKGSSSVFAIEITSPSPLEVTTEVPTPVIGQACGAIPIVAVNLNGWEAEDSLANQSCVYADPDDEDTGDICTVPINEELERTDIERDITLGDMPLGTFDQGSNRLVARATDELGNRTYKRVVFATGDVAAPGIDPIAFQQMALESVLQDELEKALLPQVQEAAQATSVEIENAFVVGISATATQELFNQLCTAPVPSEDPELDGLTPGEIFAKKVREAILAIPDVVKSVYSPCSCDPDVTMGVESVTVGETISCNVVFSEDKFNVSVGLPGVTVEAAADGECGGYGNDICFEGIGIHMDATASITGINLNFDVTEGNLLNTTTSTPVFFEGNTSVNVTGEPDLCGVSEVCDVLVTIFTFGAIDVTPEIDFSKVQDFSGQIGAAEPDPVKLKAIKVDEEVVANFDQKLSGNVYSVEITANGIAAGLRGTFATTALDPEIEQTPGAVLTPAPVPQLPVPYNKDVFIGLADDTLNMMFASMTMAGRLKGECTDTGKTIGDVLPDCETIDLVVPLATALARGACHGILGTDCETLSYGNNTYTASEQGICHSYQNHDCNTLELSEAYALALIEKGACTNGPKPNLHADQHLLFCAGAGIPPRMLFEDNWATPAVEAALRLNDLSVGLVVDRDGSAGQAGPLSGVEGCFATGGNTAADCSLLAACLDLNFDFEMQFLDTCPDDKPGFRNKFTAIQLLNRQFGTMCSGTIVAASDDVEVLHTAATDETVEIDLSNRAEVFAPEICGAGLTMGNFLQCSDPTVFTIDTDAPSLLKDYIAITCDVDVVP